MKIKHSLLFIIKFIFSRVIILFLIAGIFMAFFVDAKHMLLKSRAKVLNRLNPLEYSQFRFYLTQETDKIDKKVIQNYIYYFKEVLLVFPNKPDALGMLGFCYYLLGDIPQSIYYYEKAHVNNATFFWYYYNLGILHLYQEEYDIAKKYFEDALKVLPQYTLLYIQSSVKIYKPLIFDLYPDRKKSEVLVSQIQKAFSDIPKILVILSNSKTMEPETRDMARRSFQAMRLQVY